MTELPYGIDAWYPVLRGGPAPEAFLDVGEASAPERIEAAWRALGEGERLVTRTTAAPGSRGALRPVESKLAADGSLERFVAFPAAGGRVALLPARDGTSLRGSMALLARSDPGSRTFWALLRATSSLGVPLRLGRPELSVWTKGGEVRETHDLAALPVAGTVTVTVAQADRRRAASLLALDRRGAARAALKIGVSDASDEAVRRESTSLERLAELVPDRAPGRLAEGQRAGRAWLAHDVIEGRRPSDALSPAHARFLAGLAAATRDEHPLSENCFFQAARRHLAALDPAEDPDWHSEYADLFTALERSMDGSPLPVTLAHGDFAPWNLVQRMREVRALDWEHFAEDAPALYDLVHFHVQAGAVLKQQKGERIFDDLERFFAGPANRVVRAARVERRDVLRLVALYVLHQGTAAELAERAEPTSQIRTGWLRHAQRALCRRLTGLLNERSLPTWTRVERDHPRRAA